MLQKFQMFVKILFAVYLAFICRANCQLVASSEPHGPSIDYVVGLLCSYQTSDYKYFHILVDKLLATEMGDQLLLRLSSCLNAGVLTTQ